jgi:hypothetical protein
MTNRPLTPEEAERERRNQASADLHGGVQVLDADRPAAAGTPAITHTTTTDPYTAAPGPLGPFPPETTEPTIEQQARAEAARANWGWSSALGAIAIILLVILLLYWIF